MNPGKRIGAALAATLGILLLAGAGPAPGGKPAAAGAPAGRLKKIVRSDEAWRKSLTREQYDVLRRKGTERAFTGRYWDHHGRGVYRCAGCGLELFSSTAKFDSGTGWPSFSRPVTAGHVEQHMDAGYGMVRTEVVCARCGGHLGHVFDDGPRPTGLRYCINSAALSFEESR